MQLYPSLASWLILKVPQHHPRTGNLIFMKAHPSGCSRQSIVETRKIHIASANGSGILSSGIPRQSMLGGDVENGPGGASRRRRRQWPTEAPVTEILLQGTVLIEAEINPDVQLTSPCGWLGS